MGRKRTCNVEDKANVPESTNAGAKLGSESSNLSANKVDLPDESKNATLNGTESQPTLRVYSSRSSSKKTAGTRGNPVRKSQRLQSVALDAPMLELQRITEEIIASDDSDDDDEQPVDDARVILEGKNLEEKVEYLLQVCKEHQETLDSMKCKMAKGTPGVTSGAGEATYKSLYIDSQKKIEALVGESHQLMKKIEDLEEENHQLNKKLEHALGKIEVYEQGNVVPSNILEKRNAVFFCPSFAKDSETACNVLSEAIRGAMSASNPSLAKDTETTCNVLFEAIRGALTTSNTDREGVPCAKRKKSTKETKKPVGGA